MLSQFGATRSVRCLDHALTEPASFVRAPLPGIRGGVCIIHASAALGASFAQYSIEFGAGGGVCASAPDVQRFVYVLEGEITFGAPARLGPGGFAYVPPGQGSFASAGLSKVVVIEKAYESLPGVAAPEILIAQRSSETPFMLGGEDSGLEIQPLLPAGFAFDFAVNVMTFAPGATLPMVEVHIMEHGLLMLEGAGVFRLGDRWYPSQAGDFLWLGPYCPQWYGALGKSPTRYLIYKDWNRLSK